GVDLCLRDLIVGVHVLRMTAQPFLHTRRHFLLLLLWRFWLSMLRLLLLRLAAAQCLRALHFPQSLAPRILSLRVHWTFCLGHFRRLRLNSWRRLCSLYWRRRYWRSVLARTCFDTTLVAFPE